ncbi:hypothetical protein EXIGLDRAFT_783357 [Exidia glandulosa HHB12029]|uniref:Uncharacterized protein n=1 Tax=Exidia glandulosa HHB12029 TaxID=1314781 RepID=A0A166N3N7_EXIGL|nr:hypothetical protein EXIGLDRAFT_783357 [Exidia glandulosa HHB12029]
MALVRSSATEREILVGRRIDYNPVTGEGESYWSDDESVLQVQLPASSLPGLAIPSSRHTRKPDSVPSGQSSLHKSAPLPSVPAASNLPLRQYGGGSAVPTEGSVRPGSVLSVDRAMTGSQPQSLLHSAFVPDFSSTLSSSLQYGPTTSLPLPPPPRPTSSASVLFSPTQSSLTLPPFASYSQSHPPPHTLPQLATDWHPQQMFREQVQLQAQQQVQRERELIYMQHQQTYQPSYQPSSFPQLSSSLPLSFPPPPQDLPTSTFDFTSSNSMADTSSGLSGLPPHPSSRSR